MPRGIRSITREIASFSRDDGPISRGICSNARDIEPMSWGIHLNARDDAPLPRDVATISRGIRSIARGIRPMPPMVATISSAWASMPGSSVTPNTIFCENPGVRPSRGESRPGDRTERPGRESRC